MGSHKEATKLLATSRGAAPRQLAAAYTALGNHDEAFRHLFRIADEHVEFNVYIKSNPMFGRLHSDPRWQELLRRMNYPPEAEVAAIAGSHESAASSLWTDVTSDAVEKDSLYGQSLAVVDSGVRPARMPELGAVHPRRWPRRVDERLHANHPF